LGISSQGLPEPPIEDERKFAGYELVIEDPEELSKES
jgi:hypothetical protein